MMRRFFYLGDSWDFAQSPFDRNRKDSLIVDYSLESFISKNRAVPFDLLFLSGKVGAEQLLHWCDLLERETTIPPVVLLKESREISLPNHIYNHGLIKGILEPQSTTEQMWKEIERVLSLQEMVDPSLWGDPHCLGITGLSPPILAVKEQILKYAKYTSMPVLILGENGVGKELVAKALYQVGHSTNEPFIATQASASGKDLLESDFFGVKRGAFTGSEERKGFLQMAHGGVFFLDEIGTLVPAHQVALLRVLEEKVVRPLGSSKGFKCNFRLISATNESLSKAIERGEFREDLFHRISTLIIKVPPLRERREDISLLANLFLEREKQGVQLTSAALDKLASHTWPGNIRELKNTVLRALVESEKANRIESRHIILFNERGQ